MANETNDRLAHDASIQLHKYNDIQLLNGSRFKSRIRNSFDNNQRYSIPADNWNDIKDLPLQNGFKPTSDNPFIKMVQYYINDHYLKQLPRILELERYYLNDNNIHYWDSKKQKADNRIASGLPHYITNIRVGYQFGNPLVYGYSSDDDNDDGSDELTCIEKFNDANDISYHDKMMGVNLMNTGRAYELMYVEEDTTNVKIAKIDPNSCFVMWSDDVEPIELFAVRYYPVHIMDQTIFKIEVYTDDHIFYFTSESNNPTSDWTYDHEDEHFFANVPISEGILNEQRQGAWEGELDNIDAHDQAVSEMANSQENFSNAILMVCGDIDRPDKIQLVKDDSGHQMYYRDSYSSNTDDEASQNGYTNEPTDKDGKPNRPVKYVRTKVDTNANVMFVRPAKTVADGGGISYAPVDVHYLTKQLNANDWKTYIDYLDAQIHKDTNTPDMSDQNFAGNVSGLAMDWKVWGADQERSITETNYTRLIMRRLRLLFTYYNMKTDSGINFDSNSPDTNPANNVTVTFTPNLPKDNQSTMQVIQGMLTAGVSRETIFDLASKVTGVSADQEQQRVDDQNKSDDDRDNQLANNIYGKLKDKLSPDSDDPGSDSGQNDNDDSDNGEQGDD